MSNSITSKRFVIRKSLIGKNTTINVEFKNYYKFNGLQGNQFNYKAATLSKNGELLFGGKNGLTVFNPKNIIENQYLPPVYITDIKIFNKLVNIRNDENSILKQCVSETEKLEIPFKYNVLTFEFAALNYSNSKMNRYRYMLESFDNEWTETIEHRNATYTNLNPGEYKFKVIASNDKGYWNEKGTSIELIILPPFYNKLWFKTVVFLVTIALIFLIFIFIFKKREIKKHYEFEKIQAEKLISENEKCWVLL